jgi:tryptophanyl-tRNA synthetase
LYSAPGTTDRIGAECRQAQIGCVDCKKLMGRCLIEALQPVHEKRAYYSDRPELVDEIITDGCRKARAEAVQTMNEVRKAVGMK